MRKRTLKSKSAHQNSCFVQEDGLIRNIYQGDQSTSTVEQVEEQLLPLISRLRSQGKQVLILTDISKVGRIPLSARTRGLQLLKSLDFDKVAIYGPSRLQKTLVNLIILS